MGTLERLAEAKEREHQEDFDQKLAAALIERGLLSEEEYQEALTLQVLMEGSISVNLWELGLVDARRLTEVGASLLGLPPADHKAAARTPKHVLDLVSKETVDQYRMIPLGTRKRILYVATATPWRLETADRVSFHAGCDTELLYICGPSLRRLQDRLYGIPVSPRYRCTPTPRKRPVEVAEFDVDADTQGTLDELVTEEQFLALYARDLGGQPEEPEIILEEELPEEPASMTVEDALLELSEAHDRDQLGDVITRFCLSRVKRVALFTCQSSKWIGWTGAGPGIDPERVRKMIVPLSPISVFGAVHSSGALYIGPMRDQPMHDCFCAALGHTRPRTVAFVPVRYQDRTVFVIYLDQGEGEDLAPEISDIFTVALCVPEALERLVRERRAGS